MRKVDVIHQGASCSGVGVSSQPGRGDGNGTIYNKSIYSSGSARRLKDLGMKIMYNRPWPVNTYLHGMTPLVIIYSKHILAVGNGHRGLFA